MDASPESLEADPVRPSLMTSVGGSIATRLALGIVVLVALVTSLVVMELNRLEWQRLLTSLPDYYMYKQFAIGELLNCVFYRNNENPQVDTVLGECIVQLDR